MKIGLFIFHRDLRIVDNNSLNELALYCDKIIPAFIFTPEQVTSKNYYKSNASIQFMIESLEELNKEIGYNKMLFMYGNTTSIVKQIIEENNVSFIGYNEDYTPYGIKRDQTLKKMCDTMNIKTICKHDFYLTKPGTIRTKSGKGTVYKKFTPFYENAQKHEVEKPNFKSDITFLRSKSIPNINIQQAFSTFTEKNDSIAVRGGRKNGLRILKKMQDGIFDDYINTRNTLYIPTTNLSAYLKFGCVSIREVYWISLNNKSFVRQLYWRDFYAHILFAYPEGVLNVNNKIKWSYNKKMLDAWKNGRTGFPLVDACMRQLNQTGYMHNRGRMLVASFLSKTLLIDWREGEKYFATKLVDYDIASNNLNWQWTILDNNPYIRIFNPWTQSQEHDAQALYIKKWIPELNDVEPKDIHNWNNKWMEYKHLYLKPIVDYYEMRERAMKIF